MKAATKITKDAKAIDQNNFVLFVCFVADL